MSDNIPGDVLIDIFNRLPIKTLVRCAFVCKSWYFLLTNPSFITNHLNRTTVSDHNSNSNSDLLIVRSCYDNNSFLNRYVEQYSLHYDNETLDEYTKLKFPFKRSLDNDNDYCSIIGSCNGLICLSDDRISYSGILFLWNPTIRKSVALPPFRVGYKSHGPFKHTIGFGFDHITNDYKVIRILYYKTRVHRPEIDIYTVSTGTWRNISHLDFPYDINERARPVYFNGAAHWLANDKTKGVFHPVILSFSMSDEVFSEIKLADDIVTNVHWLPYFAVVIFQGSLSLLQQKLYTYEFNYSLWVMKEYGVAESLTKQVGIILYGEEFKWFAGFRKNGEVVLAKQTHLECYEPTCEPKPKPCKVLGIHGSPDHRDTYSFYVGAYKESLVLLGSTSCDTLAREGSRDLHQEGSELKTRNDEIGANESHDELNKSNDEIGKSHEEIGASESHKEIGVGESHEEIGAGESHDEIGENHRSEKATMRVAPAKRRWWHWLRWWRRRQ